jgi:hypothetical protein
MAGAPCVAVDYDLSDNPSLIRALLGLFRGPAKWTVKDWETAGPSLVLWFALDRRMQAESTGGRLLPARAGPRCAGRNAQCA